MPSESDIVKHILDAYNQTKYTDAWREQSGSFKVGNRWIKVGFNGKWDIEGIVNNGGIGQFFAVECKTLETAYGRKGLSEDQEIAKQRVLQRGGIFIHAKSLEDVQEVLNPIIMRHCI